MSLLDFFRYFILFLLSKTLLQQVSAEPCRAEPTSHSITQLTKEGSKTCTCCEVFDVFINSNEFVYTLFYAKGNNVNLSIIQKYSHLYQDWKHTKVAFAMIDVVVDHEIASQWLEPGQVPTNILFLKGQPVRVQDEDFQQMLTKYYGSPDGAKWLLTKYFGTDKYGTNMHYAKELATTKRFNKMINATVDWKTESSTDIIVKWTAVAFFPYLTDQFSAVSVYREAVWDFNHPPPKTRKSTHKPIDCYMSYSGEVAQVASLSGDIAKSLDISKTSKSPTPMVRKGRDSHAVLRLYGMPSNGKKYVYLDKEINFNRLESKIWKAEVLKFLIEKETYLNPSSDAGGKKES